MHRIGPVKLALLLTLPLLGATLLKAGIDDDAGAWDAAAVGLTVIPPLTSAVVLIRRGRRASRLRREARHLRARAGYLEALRAECAIDPVEAQAQAHARELEALRIEEVLVDVTARIRRHPRTVPTVMTIAGGLGTVGFLLAALLTGRFQEEWYSDEQRLYPDKRRMAIGYGAGAAASFALLLGGAAWNVRSGMVRRALEPQLRQLRQDRERLLPVIAPVVTASGAGLVLSGRF